MCCCMHVTRQVLSTRLCRLAIIVPCSVLGHVQGLACQPTITKHALTFDLESSLQLPVVAEIKLHTGVLTKHRMPDFCWNC